MFRRIKDYLGTKLRRQLVFSLLICILLPFALVVGILFIRTREEMKAQQLEDLRQKTQIMGEQLELYVHDIQRISDSFAYDDQIYEVLDEEYSRGSLKKLMRIYDLKGYFYQMDPMEKYARISAILAKSGQVFNFLQPDLDSQEVFDEMMRLGAKNKFHLAILKWHPLQENTFVSSPKGSVRQDQVVVGVRRILNGRTGEWMCSQFFVEPEENLYNIYRELAQEMNGDVYVIDSNGNLISSTQEESVRQGVVPEPVQQAAVLAASGQDMVEYKRRNYLVDSAEIPSADWKLFTMVPVSVVTAPIDRLFSSVMTILGITMAASILMLNWISKRFLRPVEVLDVSMRDVYDGNLEAYVEPETYHGEIKNMMIYYNAMLHQINRFIRDSVEAEKKKKELELEVLMGQINPHFLYNTLENIVWKSNEAGAPDIGRLAASLGRLYRLSIGTGEPVVTISQEVEHVMAYVNIQKNRYKGRVEFELQVDNEAVRGYSMIKLTLQPVVENCFMYAMEGIDHPLHIRLSIQVEDEYIRFYVEDDGKGLTEGQLSEVRRQIEEGRVRTEEESRRKKRGTGIGIYSVKERIAIYTGHKNGVSIESQPGTGTVVTITIPKIKWKDKNSQ